MGMNKGDMMIGAGWRQFCERMADLGDRITSDNFPSSERDRAEGFRHLANQVCCWLTYSIGHTDASYPQLFWHNNLVYRWGGPNVDQNARRAIIAGDGTYRISGNMHACEDFILQVKKGEMHTGGSVITGEARASDLGLRPGDGFEILLSPKPQPGTWIPLDPESNLVHIRDYYWDWQAAESAAFAIERLDTQGVPKPPLSLDRIVGMLEEAARQVEGSIEYWNDYQLDIRANQQINNFGPPAKVPEGVRDIDYCHAFINLADDEALLVQVDPADASYWDIQVYNRAWYESLDLANRQTSLNHRLAHHSADGAIRVVIAGRDPGAPNWIDTEGRQEVMATMRWWHAPSQPSLRQEIVKLDDLRRRLPDDTPVLDTDARHEQIRRRAAHVSWRFHT
jgi:hypothetical protein